MSNKYSIMKKKYWESKNITYCIGATGMKCKTTTIAEAFNEIKNEKFAKKIEAIRNNKNGQKASIKKQLKAYIFSGVFECRKINGLSEYSEFCVLDFDHVKDLENSKNLIFDDDYIFATWISPGGEGIKALVSFDYSNLKMPTNSEELGIIHKDSYCKFQQYFTTKYPSLVLDSSGKDISRICFTSSDPNLLEKSEVKKFVIKCSTPRELNNIEKKVKIKDNSTFLTFDEKDVINIVRKRNNRKRRTLNSIIKYLTKRNKSITKNYSDWYTVGQAIANEFSYNIGKEYYLKLCKLDGNLYFKNESTRKLIECYINAETQNKKQKVGLYRIKELAQNEGWNMERVINSRKGAQ